MPLPISPDPISLADLQTNFGGTDPISINEYYRRGARVADVPENNKVPTAGTISLENFYGAVSKITVVNNGTLLNVDMRSAFTISGIDYWIRNVEKEYINNGTIGSNDSGSAALTVSGSRSGAFTLTNNGNIYGAGGNGGTVGALAPNGIAGGTSIRNNSSNYTIVNSSTGNIWAGGGGGARGRNGGQGGQGGDGRPSTGFFTQDERQVISRSGSCYNGSGGYPRNTIVYRDGRKVSEDYSGPSPAGTGWRLTNVRQGPFFCFVDTRRFIRIAGRRVQVGGNIWETYGVEAVFRRTVTILTYQTFAGCEGVSGNQTGGRGGQGQGYQRQSGPESGAAGSPATGGKNCCANSGPGPVGRLAGCGGARGSGGAGSSGGTWGQAGGTQTTSTATAGSTGDPGLNAETGASTPGRAGQPVGNNPSTPGRGGYYLEGSSGASITFSNSGSVLGGLT
jgi:hypothetical protein